MNFFSLLTAALTLGCCYGLLAMSYALLYNLCGIFQYAHGDLLMVGGYAGLAVLQSGGNLFLALLTAVLLCGLLSFAAGRLIYEPLRSRPGIRSFLAGMGLSFLLQGVILLLFGAVPRAYPAGIIGRQVHRGTVSVPYSRGLIFTLAPPVLAGLWLLYRKSPRFLTLRAASGAECCGISRTDSARFVFLFSGMLAGFSGVLYGCNFTLSPYAGVLLGLRAFTAAILGGTASPAAAFTGGLILGLTETLLAGIFPSPFLDAAVFGILFLLLFCRRETIAAR